MNIRSSLCVAAVLSLITFNNSSAIEVSLGVKGGIELSRFYGADKIIGVDENFNETEIEYDPYEDQVLKPGFTVGAALQLKLANMFAIQPELLFSSKGEKYKDGSDYLIYSLNYLEIPVLFKFLIPAGIVTPQLFAGPSLAIRLGKINIKAESDGEVENLTEEERKNADKGISRMDFGIAIGGGIGIKAGPGDIIVDARYTLGLIKIAKLTDEMKAFGITYDDLPKDKNSALSFEVGYLFNL